jgi:hypothetical protein
MQQPATWGDIARRSSLPLDVIERQRRKVYEQQQYRRTERERAEAEVGDVRRERAARPLHSTMPDAELRQLAELRAELMGERLTLRTAASDAAGFLAWINEQLDQLGAGYRWKLREDRPEADQLAGMVARVRCPLWWRRRLRRAVVLLRETEGMTRHEVCATRRQPYVTDDTLRRRLDQLGRNAAILAATELENDSGDVFTLAQLAEKSTSNKAIRRGELMTRIVGCERYADAAGDAGLFITATCPSRFHPTLHHGAPNPRHDGSDARAGQAWLRTTWARARAAMQRAGLAVYGFRVAEPHHDGTPHWHMLIWTPARHAEQVEQVLRRYWLADAGSEPGASEHRLTCKRMWKGHAAGYVAKYIAKGIDDEGAVGEEGHRDDYDGEAVPMPAQEDMFGGPAQRVEAWAAAWGIRQFQPLGQPPVTVWRELRRVEMGEMLAASHRMCRAWRAVHRDGEQLADWHAYLTEQGGTLNGRFRFLDVATVRAERQGRYEAIEQERPVGVSDRTEPGYVARSNRREWRPRGAWHASERKPAKPASLTRTRFNNCTRRNSPACYVAGRLVPRGAPLMTWQQAIRTENRHGEGVAGSFNDPPEELSPWTGPPTPPMTRSAH